MGIITQNLRPKKWEWVITPNLQIELLSDETVGSAAPAPSLTASKRPAFLIEIIWLIFGALLLQLIVLTIIVQRQKSQKSLNNTAFVYLQKGLTKEAEKLLGLEIEREGGEAISLANYGLAIGLNGDVTGAAVRLDAAAWWAKTRYEKAVVEYDKAILSIFQGTTKEAIEHLRAAFSHSRAVIARYCAINTYIQAACSQDPEFLALVQQQGHQPSSPRR